MSWKIAATRETRRSSRSDDTILRYQRHPRFNVHGMVLLFFYTKKQRTRVLLYYHAVVGSLLLLFLSFFFFKQARWFKEARVYFMYLRGWKGAMYHVQ